MEIIRVSILITMALFTVTATMPPKLMNISPYARISSQIVRENLGIVKYVRNCGGTAKVVQWRFEPCSESDPICQVAPSIEGKLNTGQIDFIPSHNIEKPALRFVIHNIDDSTSQVLDNPASISTDGVLEKGHLYTVTVSGNLTEQIAGKNGIFQFILYDMNSNGVEFCAEADFKFN